MQRARPRRWTALVALLAAVIAFGLIPFRPAPVYACSCASDNAWVRLERADAAFIGRLLEAPDRSSESGEGVYTFSVEQSVKGDLPDVIQVRSPLSGAACGFELGPGLRIGIFLRLNDGAWEGGLCDQIRPDELLAAAEPLPEPDGSGPIAALVGMRTSEGRTVALDTDGRTLVYGKGEGHVLAYAPCPGSRTVVEYVYVPGERGLAYRVSVRDLQGFHILREVAAPELFTYISAIACLDEAGDEVLLFEPRSARLVRVDASEVEIVAEFEERSYCESPAAIDVPHGAIYFSGAPDCRTLFRYDIAEDRIDELARIPKVAEGDSFGALALSPDGRYLAVEAHPGPRMLTFRIFILDLASESGGYIEEVYRSGYEPAAMLWLASDRLLVTGTDGSLEGAVLLTPALEVVATITGVEAGLAGLLGNRIYVLERGGRLLVAPDSGGSARELRLFADQSIRAFAMLGTAVTFDPAARRPDNLLTIADASTASAGEESMWPSTPAILGIGLLSMLLVVVVASILRIRRQHLSHSKAA